MKHIWVLLLILFPLLTFAQVEDENTFTADRPGATNGVDVLPKGRLQWETGIGFERSKLDGPTTKKWTLNTSTMRWGFSDYAELRLQGDWLFDSCEGEHHNGLSNVAIGTKVRLFDGWNAIPAMALLAHVFIPGNNEFMPEHWGGQVALAFQNELAPWLSLGYEGNLTWSDSDRPEFFYGACLCFAFAERWQLLTEEYNCNNSDGTENWVELGVAYQLTERLQLDMSTDFNLNYPRRFCNQSVGLSWQITK